MLWFVGLGISGFKSIPIEAIDILSNSDLIKIKNAMKGEFKLAKRWLVEDGNEILKNAKKKKVVLLAYGDPYIATTHIELRTRAIEEKIKTRSIHASSSLTSMKETTLYFC